MTELNYSKSGFMLDGDVYNIDKQHLSKDRQPTEWPTPVARDYKDCGDWQKLSKYAHKKRLGCVLAEREQQSGQMNPQFVEWLMGFPLGHTEL